MAMNLTTKDLAEELETDPKTLRKFLRSQESPVTPVGQGNRYTIDGRTARSIRKAFRTWQEAHTRSTQAA
jgi:hypothetical protein